MMQQKRSKASGYKVSGYIIYTLVIFAFFWIFTQHVNTHRNYTFHVNAGINSVELTLVGGVNSNLGKTVVFSDGYVHFAGSSYPYSISRIGWRRYDIGISEMIYWANFPTQSVTFAAGNVGGGGQGHWMTIVQSWPQVEDYFEEDYFELMQTRDLLSSALAAYVRINELMFALKIYIIFFVIFTALGYLFYLRPELVHEKIQSLGRILLIITPVSIMILLI